VKKAKKDYLHVEMVNVQIWKRIKMGRTLIGLIVYWFFIFFLMGAFLFCIQALFLTIMAAAWIGAKYNPVGYLLIPLYLIVAYYGLRFLLHIARRVNKHFEN